MSSFEASLKQLPKPILRKLRSVIRRIRRLQLFRGICATLAIALLCLLLIMAVDASITLFTYRARWTLSLAGVALTLLACWWFLIRPLSKRITLTQVARALEDRHPELQERISTAVELMSSDDPEEIKGSQELIEAVVDSAVADVETVDPRREFNTGKARKFLAIGLTCVGILAAVLVLFPNHGYTLLKRAIAPSRNIGNAYAETMIVNPGNHRIPKGSKVAITMTIKHDRLKRAELRRLLSDGKESIERMTLLGKTDEGHQQFLITFNNIEEDFQYRVRAGAALSEYYTIESVSPPIIEEQTIRYEYPAYTNLAPKKSTSFDGSISAVAHTKVTVTSTSNKPVQSATTLLNDNQPFGETTFTENQITSSFTLSPKTSGTWHLEIIDQDDFENEKVPYSIQVANDQDPIITITNPVAKELTLKPVEVVPISYQASEDFGFNELVIIANINGEEKPRELTQSLPIKTEAGIWRGQAMLNLAELKLTELNRVVTIQLRIRDNRPNEYGGPGEAFSEPITIYIKQNAESLAEQAIESQKKEIEKAIRDARANLNIARSKISSAQREILRNPELTGAAKRNLDNFEDETKTAAFNLKEATKKLKESVFSQEATNLEKIANEELKQARDNAERVPVQDSQKQRKNDLELAEQDIKQALEKLLDIEKAIREKRDDLEKIVELNEMANSQRQLAQDAAALAEQDQTRQDQIDQSDNQQLKENLERTRQASLDAFKQQQSKLKDQFGNLVKQSPTALQEALEKQKQKAEQLAKDAEQLRDQPNEQIETNSEQLAKSAEQLEKDLSSLNQRQSKYEAAHAKNYLKEAARKSDPQSLQTAAESLTDSAEQIDRSIQDLAKRNNDQESQPIDPKKMADSFEQLSNVEQSKDASQAADQAKQAAQSLQNLAQQAMSELGQLEGLTPKLEDPLATPEEQAALAQLQEIQKQQEQLAEDAKQQAELDENRQRQIAQTTDEQLRNQLEQQSQQQLEQFADRQNEIKEQLADLLGQDNAAIKEALDTQKQTAEELSKQASRVARQQERLEELANDTNAKQAEKLERKQQELAEDSAQLAQAAEQLKQSLGDLNQTEAREKADSAANSLQTASEQAQKASQQLAPQQNQTNPGQPQQQASQQALNDAAESLKQSAEQIDQQMQQLGNPDADKSENRAIDPKEMAKAFQEIEKSAQSKNANQAAKNANEISQNLKQMTEQAIQELGKPSGPIQQGKTKNQQNFLAENPNKQPDENYTDGTPSDAQVPPELQKLGISGSDWARLKGTLTNGGTSSAASDVPEEYRDLVARYFKIIATEANRK